MADYATSPPNASTKLTSAPPPKKEVTATIFRDKRDRDHVDRAVTDVLRAPRGALLYGPRSGHGLEEVSLDLMADP